MTDLGMPDLAYVQEGHPYGVTWTHKEWQLLWLLAEARWWAEFRNDAYNGLASIDDPDFPRWADFPWAEKVASS